MARGKFIVLEGIDGAGTSTQAEALERAHPALHRTREPSDGPIGKLIRTALVHEEKFSSAALALLFAADRLDHFAREIEPALAAGRHVLSDRYVLSSLVYQSQFVDLDFVKEINARAPAPDVTILVDVDADLAARRRRARGGPEELFDAIELQRQLAARYRQLAGPHVVVVDGSGAIEQVSAKIEAAIRHASKEPGRESSLAVWCRDVGGGLRLDAGAQARGRE